MQLLEGRASLNRRKINRNGNKPKYHVFKKYREFASTPYIRLTYFLKVADIIKNCISAKTHISSF